MSDKYVPRKSFAERRQTVVLQMEKMYKDMKTKYRKRIVLALFVCLVVLIAFIVYIVITRRKEQGICFTEECKEYATEIYSNLNLDIDPCDNFYEFACGGWMMKNPRPKDKTSWSVWDQTYDNIYKQMRNKFDSGFEEMKDSVTIQNVKNFYKGCKNFELRNFVGIEELKSTIRDKIGWFPMASVNESRDSYDWEKTYVYASTSLNVNPFFYFGIGWDKDTNYTTKIIWVIPQMNLPRKLGDVNATRKEIEKEKEKYRKEMTKMVLTLYPQLTKREIDDQLDEVVELLVKLCNALRNDKETYGKGKKLTLDQMEYTFPKVNWFQIFSDIFDRVKIRLKREEPITMWETNYFEKLGTILSSTSKRTIANFIALEIIAGIGSQTIPQIEEIKSEKEITNEERIKRCYYSTEFNFEVAVNHIFVKSYFCNESLQELKEFVKQLKASLTLTIQQSEWMDDDTKLKAQLKLNKMLDYVAAPSWIENEQELDNYYGDISYISNDNYYASFKKMKKWNRFNELTSLKEDDKVAFSPTVVNAFFYTIYNKIVITSGILNPPFYRTLAPLVMNFGGIGTIIGHEITHGFDSGGAEFDEKGQQVNWWKNDTREKFKEKVDCFVRQYSEQTEPIIGKKVNGTFTIKDNIADNGGIKQAFRAYKIYTSTKQHKRDLKLPKAMDQFSKDQLFFIAYASCWCNDNSKDYLEFQLKYDPHSPERIRVNVPLSNSDDFSKAFNCPEGSKMNPKHKCLLW